MRKSRWAAVMAVIAVAGAAIAASAVARRDRPVALEPAATMDATENDFVTPSYLPPGSTLANTSRGDDPPFVEKEYQLPGAANADTVPPGGIDDTNLYAVHPATVITVTYAPEVNAVPAEIVAGSEFSHVTPAVVGGHPGFVTTAKNGLGVVRIDWVDDAGYHIVMCERLKTVDGVSGVTADELLKVASSLYE
jgi:hypothetical protein